MFPELLRDDVFRLETKRLWLRWPRAADARAVATLAGDRDVAEMTAHIPHPYPPGVADKWVQLTRAGNLEGRSLVLALTFKARPDEAIGAIGLRETAPGEVELGYWLGKPYWRIGLMSEAARALLALVWRVTDADAIQASTLPGNTGSRRVLEKCGFLASGERMMPAPARGGDVLAQAYELPRPARSTLREWRKCA